MAAPHVAGAVALVAATAPAEGAEARVARILASVDTPSALAGKCQTDGRLNVATALSTSAPTPTVDGVEPDQRAHQRRQRAWSSRAPASMV